MTLLLQLLANGVANGMIFAVLAVGFGLVYRSTRVFHVAYGATAVLAAFIFHSLVSVGGLGYWVAGAITTGLSAAFGWVLETGFYRPFLRRGTAPGAVMVASIGMGLVIENCLALLYGNQVRAIPRELTEALSIGSVRFTTIQAVQVLVCGGILATLATASKLHFFRVTRAMGENPELLQVHGWRLERYRALVFALSGALAAVASCLIMLDVGMDVHAGMSYLLFATVAVLAGGVAHMPGWVIGGIGLALIQSLVVWKLSATWMDLVAFSLLITVLLFRRDGILSARKRTEET